MAETGSDQTLMALLALEADPASALAEAAGESPMPRPPTFEQRIALYLAAVYGRNAAVTEEMREAAREHLLAVMAADLAEQTGVAPEIGEAPASVFSAGTHAASRAASATSPLRESIARGLRQMTSAAAALFTVPTMRMAAVPLVALLVVGSLWTRDWLQDHDASGGNAALPADSDGAASGPSTRSLAPPSQRIDPAREQSLKRAIAAQEAAHRPDDLALAQTLAQLGALYRSEGRYEAAEGLYKRALRIERDALGANDPRTLRTINDLAAVYRLEGRGKDADRLLSQTEQ